MQKIKVIIMGAAGRDFHNFNTFYRNNSLYEVVAFTATQIPNIEDRKYPASLAGKLYPRGIKIYPEEKLTELIKNLKADEVIFSYSDVSHEYVMHKASIVSAAGASFKILGTKQTMIKSKRLVVSIGAVRTGSGKSQVSRKVVKLLVKEGLKVVAIRHPMPYGDLAKQALQRFASYEDFEKHNCTIEELEEYEPYIEMGLVIYAGVDYGEILKHAEKEADVIVWDGGNNDTPFYKSDLHIVLVDPLRPGHEVSFHPGESNARIADVIIINKVNAAKKEDIKKVLDNVKRINPKAKIIKSSSITTVDDPSLVSGKRVLVIEDGPTVTHGGMPIGAGYNASLDLKAKEIIDPRPYAVGSIAQTFKHFPHLTKVLPAMGYGERQMDELSKTINKADCDTVVVGTPINLAKLLKINKKAVRVTYDVREISKPNLSDLIKQFVKKYAKRA